MVQQFTDVAEPNLDGQIELGTATWSASPVVSLCHRLSDAAEQPNLVKPITGTTASLRTTFADDLLRGSGIGTRRRERISLDGQRPIECLACSV